MHPPGYGTLPTGISIRYLLFVLLVLNRFQNLPVTMEGLPFLLNSLTWILERRVSIHGKSYQAIFLVSGLSIVLLSLKSAQSQVVVMLFFS